MRAYFHHLDSSGVVARISETLHPKKEIPQLTDEKGNPLHIFRDDEGTILDKYGQPMFRDIAPDIETGYSSKSASLLWITSITGLAAAALFALATGSLGLHLRYFGSELEGLVQRGCIVDASSNRNYILVGATGGPLVDVIPKNQSVSEIPYVVHFGLSRQPIGPHSNSLSGLITAETGWEEGPSLNIVAYTRAINSLPLNGTPDAPRRILLPKTTVPINSYDCGNNNN